MYRREKFLTGLAQDPLKLSVAFAIILPMTIKKGTKWKQ